jgi:hypothetical protein
MKPEFGELEIDWPSVSTLTWDGDEIVDVTTGQRATSNGSVSPRSRIMTYPFDRAIGLRHSDAFWAIVYSNRGTKSVLLKNGSVYRELNRSFYCAEDYDYPIAIGTNPSGRVVVVHCPREFNLLEIEDAESGEGLSTIKSKQMEFHSRLAVSSDGRFLLDAGWFWHPWSGACVFDLKGLSENPSAMEQNAVFSSSFEIDGAALLGNNHLVVSSTADDSVEGRQSNDLGSKQLGVWSLVDHRWKSKSKLTDPSGTIMPWKEWIISFYDHPKLIELSTGRIVHRWDHIFSGKQIGPIEIGDPPPPPMAIDYARGRFAVADSKKVTVVSAPS